MGDRLQIQNFTEGETPPTPSTSRPPEMTSRQPPDCMASKTKKNNETTELPGTTRKCTSTTRIRSCCSSKLTSTQKTFMHASISCDCDDVDCL